jgi:L-fucose isomerase-like protein
MAKPCITLFPIARTTFDLELANKFSREMRSNLERSGFDVHGPAELLTSLNDVKAATRDVDQRNSDLLLVFQATFADSSMVISLVEQVDLPLLLWAVPEEASGGRLRLNSLCGINLAGHALRKQRIPYEYIYAPPGDQDALHKLEAIARAGLVERQLKQARLGVVGERPAGFESCDYDREKLQDRFGIEVVPIDLEKVFQLAGSVGDAEVASVRSGLAMQLSNLDSFDQKPLNGTLAVYIALKQITRDLDCSALAVRCWPEFFTELGCAACGAMSMLSNESIPCSCEADVNGTVTQLILQWLSGQPSFGTDFVSVDEAADQGVFWHCGLAPLDMADPEFPAQGTLHSNRRLPLLMEFPLKPGTVTVSRLSQASGEYQLLAGKAEMLSAPPSFSGTSGVVRFERPIGEVLDTILSEGLEHHVSLTYGNHVDSLVALARRLDLPLIRI